MKKLLAFIFIINGISFPTISGELVAVCANPYSITNLILSSTSSTPNSYLKAPTTTNSTISLYRDGENYDIIVNLKFSEPRSLLKNGVIIQGMEMGPGMYHLLVFNNDAQEHFIFTMQENGFGSFLWGSNSNSGKSDELEFDGECFTP